MFSESGLTASGYREKMRLCSRCGERLNYIEGNGYCCPKGHGCWWPQPEREPPEDKKARCYHAGDLQLHKGGAKSGKKRGKKKVPSKLTTETYLLD